MPRQKRLNLPGTLFHVVARGIERRRIFSEEADYQEFLRKLELALDKSRSRCYAWALMPNHFHLLVRTSEFPLSELMQRLMGSYAGYFNRRHHRSGHLFQNRYKSILCQEDAYFLELVRYIHLNPVRAGIVKSPRELEHFPFTGHKTLVGKELRPWQACGEVLERFHRTEGRSVSGYRKFIEEGWEMGNRPDLMGGGLRRSAGGWEGVRALKRDGDYWQSDARILGDGAFVSEVLAAADETLSTRERLSREGWTLDKIVLRSCEVAEIEPKDIYRKGRRNSIARAKSLMAYWAFGFLGIKRKALAERFGVSSQAVSQWVQQGRSLCEKEPINLIC